jgi:hypothetical protein
MSEVVDIANWSKKAPAAAYNQPNTTYDLAQLLFSAAIVADGDPSRPTYSALDSANRQGILLWDERKYRRAYMVMWRSHFMRWNSGIVIDCLNPLLPTVTTSPESTPRQYVAQLDGQVSRMHDDPEHAGEALDPRIVKLLNASLAYSVIVPLTPSSGIHENMVTSFPAPPKN